MKQIEKYSKRTTNIEIVRIIAMLLIVMSHYSGYSGFNWESIDGITINKIFMNTFFNFGTLGVSLFIIISGYFYDKNKVNLYKVVRLILQIFIFSIIGLIIGIIIGDSNLNMKNIIKSIMPTTFGLYWFATCYILIYLFSPFIKMIIDKFSKRDLKILITLMILIWSLITMIPGARTFWNEFIWLVVIYIIGAYIKKYNINILKNNNRIVLVILIMVLLSVFMIIMELLSTKLAILKDFIRYFNNIQSPFILILTILIFNIFKNINIKNNTYINAVATSTFGIYLIHENVFLRNFIWKNIVQGNKYINSPVLIINAIIGVIAIFVICSIISFIIENYVVKYVMKILEKIGYKISKQKLYLKVKTRLADFYNN